MSDKETEELNKLWDLFKDQPEEIRTRREQVTNILNENELKAFPTNMLVTTAFDELFQCFSIGGQIKNYYRYGGLSYCEEQREKLWFAVRHGNYFNEKPINENSSHREIEKAKQIQQFYKNRLLQQKAKGSSEDIWEPRDEMLNDPFKK